ncbi:site-specific integrase [Acinetobacter baumannii]|uniref:site-specific integrase n=1 Tax=Acinetobacter baumannii TaxID=470 RepID=UPI0003DF89F8|nr:site-specific integrase [Acinetobacter baumannii]ETQ99874.1 site-specific recombinase, phage integrase family [Acinetobacter baumannii UH6507]
MFALKTIHLEKKVSNENQINLLFDLDTTCPCLYPMLYTMKSLRFQSISTQHADLIALKFWYDFWFEKFATSFCESFYSSSYNFEIIQSEIDNFIIYLENNKKIESNLIRLRNADHTNYTTIGHRIRSFLKFYSFLIDEYLTIQSQPQLSLKEIQKIKENLNKYMTIKKKIINNFSKSNKTIKSEINYSFKSMNDEMIKGLYLIISPSNFNKYNTLNPFKSKNVQLRNFLIIHLMLNYGLRIGELMLLTTNSIKKSIQNHNLSLIITNTDDEFDDRSKKPKIKNEYSYRVIKLQERDYRILQIYINEIRKEIPSQILFTSLKPPYSALSYASVKKIFDQVDLSLKALLPECFDTSAYDSIDRLTPHVCRHSWAYMMLTPQWFELFLQNWIHNKLTVTQAVYETNKHFYSSNNDPSKYLALSIFGNPFKRY